MSKLQATRRFHGFPLLPPELRLQIWEAAIPGPIVHELYPTSNCTHYVAHLRSNSRKTPVLLHTCREARAVALQHFQLMRLESEPGFHRTTPHMVASIAPFYFNPARDTLFLNCVASIFLYIRFYLVDEGLKIQRPMLGWQNVALDSLHLAFVAVLATDVLSTPHNRMQELFPDLRELGVVLDSKGRGRKRLRASLSPGRHTRLFGVKGKEIDGIEEIMAYFAKDFSFLGKDEEEGSETETVVVKVKTLPAGEEPEGDSDLFASWHDGTPQHPEPIKPTFRMMRVQRERFYVSLRQGFRHYCIIARHSFKVWRKRMANGSPPSGA